ncbi:ATP-binding protein [Arhodomonas sp. SL1]|uniref:ATP-binding protein n=1 Tax=Arhodomonas sp. SL1 TaxID=3425691 RepID=UPI003F880D60
MGRPGITAKLFVAFLGIALLVVVLMAGAVQWTFRSDFLEYVREREGERMEELAEALEDYYDDHQGWAGLREEGRWRRTVRHGLWRERDDEEHEGRDGGRAVPPPGAGPTLLDADGDRVAGPGLDPESAVRIRIEEDDRTLGWLVYRPSSEVTEGIALRFQHQQLETAWAIAGISAALAALLGLLLARGFLAPVRRLATATRALAAGDYATRVREDRRDELGQLARDFNRLAETLERNERLRREVMSDLSHELRTPVSVLRAELEAMEDGVRPLTPEAVAGLQESVATLGRLIDDLYELSLADAGALSYRMEAVELTGLLSALVEQWRPRFEQAGLALGLDLPAEAVTVRGDRRRLEQLWGNLLQNSLRYTDVGGEARLRLEFGAERVTVRLEDSAPAVPEAALGRIFERLYRVEGSRSRASGGAGLGLAICRSIVEAHGGSIEAYASPLGGLGILVRLPRQ